MEELLQRLREFRDARNWDQFHDLKNLAISVTLEAAELLQIFQWLSPKDHLSASQREAVASESADILVYLIYLCDKLDIDLIACTGQKIERNEKRYPVDASRDIAGTAGRADGGAPPEGH
ncbi:MAG TPA: nucleotide pyrophosphohydrolase [Allosphingosinicella sp.]|jgi:NTP pyrophosphatase (non-canonical NTP hydrolase)|nr:nucleotide pyrophosphohydrolase [Allosphingosinicella sp.]